MTDEKFTELVNLFLDEEISPQELRELERELASSPERKAHFTERLCLHRATQMALAPQRQRPARPTRERWWLASGLAAGMVLGLMMWVPAQFGLPGDPEGVAAEIAGIATEEDPLASLGRREVERFLVAQQRLHQERASLVAQMRLMGLRPELTPVDKQLRPIQPGAIEPRTVGLSQAERLLQLQELRAIPEPRLLRVEASSPGNDTGERGFESAGFEFRRVGQGSGY